MKKNDCKHCHDQTCRECGRQTLKSTGASVNPDSYAAEFLLYAFHFRHQIDSRRSNTGNHSVPLMLLASEG